ncbi:MAG: hypothetical protein HY714_05260 [Candidatus Omnitrophica bacterium]|nr:hypothetical protein [Candidatus Omnitrophota bacterium]
MKLEAPSAGQKPLSGILAALLIVVWGLAVRTLLVQIGEAREGLRARRDQLAYQKGILGNQDVFVERYREMRKEVVSEGGTAEDRMTLFVTQLENWAREEKLLVQDIRPLPAEQNDRLTLLKVSLEIEGEMGALARLMHRISSSKEPIRIDRFNFFQKVRMRREVNLELELSFIYLA